MSRVQCVQGKKWAGLPSLTVVVLPHDQSHFTMLAINWKNSWPLVEAAIIEHNKGHVIGVRKDGKPRYDLQKVIRAPHRHLLKEMVRLYSIQLAGLKWLHLTSQLPPYRTHCGELGREMNLCKCTVNNLLARLVESGLVAQKEHRGRCNKFALRFDPAMIVIHPELALRRQLAQKDGDAGDFENEAFEEHERENLQQSLEAGPFKKENKLSVETVENEESSPIQIPLSKECRNYGTGTHGAEAGGPRLQNGWSAKSNAQKIAKIDLATTNAIKGGTEAGDPRLQVGERLGAGREKIDMNTADRLQETRLQVSGERGVVAERPALAPDSGIVADYYLRLLIVIVGTLYSRLDFMAKSQMDAIKEFIHYQFEGKDTEQAEATYRELWLRIGLAEKWLKKKPGRYIPIPSVYLAPNNPNGFDRTKQWLENMRMTNERAEKAKQRYQYLAKSIGAVLHSTGKHLEEQSIHSYLFRRNEVTDKFQYLGTAFDWIVLDPRSNVNNTF